MEFRESNNLELKRELTDGFEKEVVAFLNTVGGQIIIGVDDSGSITGLDIQPIFLKFQNTLLPLNLSIQTKQCKF